MKKRTRVLSGIVTLVALAFSLAGSAWASSMCMPAMAMDAPVQSMAHDAMPGHACMPAHAEHRDDAPTRAPQCPFGSAGMTGACAPVSLPAAPRVQIAASPEVMLARSTSTSEPHAVTGTPLFHPPRA